MAVTRYARAIISAGPGTAGAFYICDTFGELPSSGLFAGDKAVVTGTQKRYTCYNGTSWVEDAGGGLGYCLNVRAASQSTTTDSKTLYWGGMLVVPSTTANRWRLYIPKAGTIKAAVLYSYAGTAGSAEDWSRYIRLNNTSDTLIATVAEASNNRVWANYALSIAVAAGDYIEIKEVCPAWATNPATVTRTGQIYIE